MMLPWQVFSPIFSTWFGIRLPIAAPLVELNPVPLGCLSLARRRKGLNIYPHLQAATRISIEAIRRRSVWHRC